MSILDVPENLSELQISDLNLLKESLESFKKQRRQEIEQADTVLVGVLEELRKRKEKGLLANAFQNAFIKE